MNNTNPHKKSQVSPSPKTSDPHTCGSEVLGCSEAKSVLYLNSNNSDETTENPLSNTVDLALQTANLLTNYHRKSAFTLASNVERMISLCPSLNHVGFLTLTFRENLVDAKESSRRFNNLRSVLFSLQEHFGIWIRVVERQIRGAIHYHMLIELKEDIRTGFDYDLYDAALNFKVRGKGYWSKENATYRLEMKKALSTASPFLHELWTLIREAAAKCGFGRTEMLPIRSNAEAVKFYLGKYISKHIGARENRDKGIRLVSYSQGWDRNSVKISWYTDNSREWRRKTQKFVNYVVGSTGILEKDQEMMVEKFTKRWVWRYRDEIFDIDQIVIDKNLEIPF